jgi:hypothetical protein
LSKLEVNQTNTIDSFHSTDLLDGVLKTKCELGAVIGVALFVATLFGVAENILLGVAKMPRAE